ncbi:MAG: glycosyltransferase family 2 protein [Bacteroidales bacterium]|nr:glycosyltransferase family 2 protein [Bacteroidales bacterium]
MQTPYFSIITPAYNRAAFLPETIRSVLQQSFENWEYIIIDDDSKDNTAEILASYSDPRIIRIKNDTNLERGASRNKGIATAKGKYICFLDSDDAFFPNHLKVLFDNIQIRQEPIALLYTTSFQRINNGPIHKREFVPFDEKNKYAYIMHYTFNHNCVCVHKEIFNHFKYDPTIPGLEDIDLWLHIATKFPIYQINEYTNLLNFHQGSYTHGDYERFTKELRNFNYIFNKPEFKGLLPRSKKNRLLSMCHYHLAHRYQSENKVFLMYKSIFKSFFFYPLGYNGRTNKPLFVMAVYGLPLFGFLLKSLYSIFKK